MYNKVKRIIYFLVSVLFFLFIVFHYFSDENKEKIYKNRLNISTNIEKKKYEYTFVEKWYWRYSRVQPLRFRKEKNKKKIFLGAFEKRLNE